MTAVGPGPGGGVVAGLSLLGAALWLSAAGCGAAGGSSPRTLRVSASAAEGEPQTLALRRFAGEIERRAAGRLRVAVCTRRAPSATSGRSSSWSC